MSESKSVSTLNDLIEINNDRIEGYRTAINNTQDSELRNMFVELIATSEKNLSELIREVYGLGGKPEEGTRTTGKIYRLWMELKAAFTGKDRFDLLASCEFGEDKALEVYEEALKDEDITSSQRYMILAQKASVKADHDKVKALRDARL